MTEESELASIEVHLLWCQHCLDRAEASDRFVDAIRAIALGDDCRLYCQFLTFRKGVHFVRLVSFQDTSQTSQALVELARGQARRLP